MSNQISDWGIFAIFFLQRHQPLVDDRLKQGLVAMAVHMVVQAFTFVVFPIIVGRAEPDVPGDGCPRLRLGFIYLCVLPSTVSSSVAMTRAGPRQRGGFHLQRHVIDADWRVHDAIAGDAVSCGRDGGGARLARWWGTWRRSCCCHSPSARRCALSGGLVLPAGSHGPTSSIRRRHPAAGLQRVQRFGGRGLWRDHGAG
jgi:hypothetical protein